MLRKSSCPRPEFVDKDGKEYILSTLEKEIVRIISQIEYSNKPS